MLEYNIIYLSIILGVLLTFYNKRGDYKLFYILICTFMIAVCGLRKDVIGIDTYNYLYYFTNPEDKSGFYQMYEADGMEPGLGWLNSFFRIFISNKYVYLLCLTALSQIPLYIFFYKFSDNKFLTLFLYTAFSIGCGVYFLDFNAMRQCLAISFFIWTLLAYMNSDGNIKSFKVLLPFVAMVLVHKSSLMVILPFLMTKMNFGKKTYVLVVCFATLIGFVMNYFFSYLEMAFTLFTGGTFYTRQIAGNGFNVIMLLPYSLICLVIIIFSKKDELNNLFFNSLILSMLIQGVMAFSGNNIDRMCAYFYVLGYIAVGNFLMSKHKALTVRLPIILCVLAYFTYKFYVSLSLMTESGHAFIPYKWCFE